MARSASGFSLQSHDLVHELHMCTNCNAHPMALEFTCGHRACESCAHSLGKCHECNRFISGLIKPIQGELTGVRQMANAVATLETGTAGLDAQLKEEEEQTKEHSEDEVIEHLPNLPNPAQINLFHNQDSKTPMCSACKLAPQAVELGCGHCVCFTCSTKLGMCTLCNKVISNRLLLVHKYHSSFDYVVKEGQPQLFRKKGIVTYAQEIHDAVDESTSSSVVTKSDSETRDLSDIDTPSDSCDSGEIFQKRVGTMIPPMCVGCRREPVAVELGCGHCLCSGCSLRMGVCNVCKKIITTRLKLSMKYRSTFDYIVREASRTVVKTQPPPAPVAPQPRQFMLQLCSHCKRSPQQAIMHCRGGCRVGTCAECTDALRNRHVKFRQCIKCDNRVIKITEPHGAVMKQGPECVKCFVRDAKHTYTCAKGCNYKLCNRCGNIPKLCCGFLLKRVKPAKAKVNVTNRGDENKNILQGGVFPTRASEVKTFSTKDIDEPPESEPNVESLIPLPNATNVTCNSANINDITITTACSTPTTFALITPYVSEKLQTSLTHTIENNPLDVLPSLSTLMPECISNTTPSSMPTTTTTTTTTPTIDNDRLIDTRLLQTLPSFKTLPSFDHPTCRDSHSSSQDSNAEFKQFKSLLPDFEA